MAHRLLESTTHMPRHLLRALALAPLLFGCGTAGDTLAEWRGQLTLELVAGDHGDTGPATSLHVLLQGPDMSQVSTNDVRCPTFDATLLVNGVKLPQLDPGGENDSWFGQSDESDPCVAPQFGLLAPLPPALLSSLTRIRVSDDSATFVAELENFVGGPTLAFPPGAAPELHAGATVTLEVTPSQPALVGQFAWVSFISDDPEATAAIFTVTTNAGALSLDENSVTFQVPDVAPASGTLVLSSDTFSPRVLACADFAACDLQKNPVLYGSSAPLAASVVP